MAWWLQTIKPSHPPSRAGCYMSWPDNQLLHVLLLFARIHYCSPFDGCPCQTWEFGCSYTSRHPWSCDWCQTSVPFDVFTSQGSFDLASTVNPLPVGWVHLSQSHRNTPRRYFYYWFFGEYWVEIQPKIICHLLPLAFHSCFAPTHGSRARRFQVLFPSSTMAHPWHLMSSVIGPSV